MMKTKDRCHGPYVRVWGLGNFYVYILTIFNRNKHEILKLYQEFYAIKFIV